MIVLDTHAWVWWVADPAKLSARARRAVDSAVEHGEVAISSISAWEVAVLVARGRIELTMDVADWIAGSEALPFVHFVPVDNRIALRSVNLPAQFHADPADRIIVATALELDARLVTKDDRIRSSGVANTVW